MESIFNTLSARVRPGRVVMDAFYSKALGFDWNYAVYLPNGYDEADEKKKYPVIYLLHGAFGCLNDFQQNFSTPKMMDELIVQGRMPEAIVVFVDGFNSFYFDGPALKMESAIIGDLIPFIEMRYHGMGTKAGRVIGGISMGGFGSARLCLKYPQMFSCAVMLSPAVWHELVPEKCSCANWGLFTKHLHKEGWEAIHPEAYFESYAKAGSPVRFFIAHGTADEAVPIEDAEIFVKKLRKWTPAEYVSIEGETHSWSFWEAGMRTGLEYAGKLLLENR